MGKKEEKNTQNEMSEGIFSGVNLKQRIPQIVEEISKKTGFKPDQILSESSWWNESTGVGAFHFNGKYKGKDVVLKVQGVKPETSEIKMIEGFSDQNTSKVIRPPHLYYTLPWNDEKQYEAYILENVGLTTVVGLPTNEKQVAEFFSLFQEYREKCRNKPWLKKPAKNISDLVDMRFKKWSEASIKVFPTHPLRLDGDKKIINKAVEILKSGYKDIDWEFQHGHFSARDLFKVKGGVIVLSNLYWSWRTPYYDLIFGYHWFMYDLAEVKNISPQKIEDQRKVWLDQIDKLGKDKKLLKLALLERAAAGLNLDALSVNTISPVAEHLVKQTRKITNELIQELSG